MTLCALAKWYKWHKDMVKLVLSSSATRFEKKRKKLQFQSHSNVPSQAQMSPAQVVNDCTRCLQIVKVVHRW